MEFHSATEFGRQCRSDAGADFGRLRFFGEHLDERSWRLRGQRPFVEDGTALRSLPERDAPLRLQSKLGHLRWRAIPKSDRSGAIHWRQDSPARPGRHGLWNRGNQLEVLAWPP